MAIKKYILAFVIVILTSLAHAETISISSIFNNYNWMDSSSDVKNKLPQNVKFDHDILQRGINIETWTKWMNFDNGRMFRTSFYFNKHEDLQAVTIFVEPKYREFLQPYELLNVFNKLVDLYGKDYHINTIPNGDLGNNMIVWEENPNHGTIILTMSRFCPKNNCIGYSPLGISYFRPKNLAIL